MSLGAVAPHRAHRHHAGGCPTIAQLREDLDLGIVEQRSAAKPQPPAGTAAPRKVEVGIYLGHLLRPPRAGIPTVAVAVLCQQEAAEAAARGVAVAYARVRA